MLTKINIKKKNIVFDFWGTLAKLEDGSDFGEKISQALGISRKKYLYYVQEQWFTQCLTASQFADILINTCGASSSIHQYIVNWILEPLNRASLYADVLQCLKHLTHNHKLFLVSDNSTNGITIIEKFGIKQFFNKIYLSCEYGKTKKNGLYHHLFEHIPSNQTVVIGDSIDGDIKPAIAYGADSILIDRDVSYDPIKSINTLGVLL